MKSFIIDLGLVTNTKRGMGVYIFNLLKNIPTEKVSFDIVLLVSRNHSKNDILVLKKKFDGVKNIKFNYSPFNHVITEQIYIPFYMFFKKKYTLVSSGDSAPILLSKSRIILILHDLYFFKGVELYSKSSISLYKTLGQIYRRNCIKRFIGYKTASVITVSHFMQNEISEYMSIPLKNISLIPNGIYIDNFISTNHKINKKGLILVSGNDPQKNLDNFLQSLQKLPQLIKQEIKEINIIGVKGSSFVIIPEIKDLKVNFLGYLNHSDVIKFLVKSKYFVLPSFYESFGIPALEALLSGCKVAASNTGALKEVLGEFAVYFNPHDIDSISNGISKMITLENYLDLSVFNHLSIYNWNISSNKFIDFLNSY